MLVRLALAAALAIPAGIALAPLSAQTAEADPEILNNPNPEALQVYGLPGGAKPKPIKDAKVQFGKAIRIDTPGGANAWSVGVNSPLLKPVKKGDKILVAFYARLEKGENGATTAKIATGQLQLSAAPYTGLFGKGFEITPEWKLYQVSGHADRDYAKGELSAALHVNTAKQTIDLGALAVMNYGQKP